MLHRSRSSSSGSCCWKAGHLAPPDRWACSSFCRRGRTTLHCHCAQKAHDGKTLREAGHGLARFNAARDSRNGGRVHTGGRKTTDLSTAGERLRRNTESRASRVEQEHHSRQQGHSLPPGHQVSFAAALGQWPHMVRVMPNSIGSTESKGCPKPGDL